MFGPVLPAFLGSSTGRLAGTVRRRARLLPALLPSARLVSVRDLARASNVALPCAGSAIRTSYPPGGASSSESEGSMMWSCGREAGLREGLGGSKLASKAFVGRATGDVEGEVGLCVSMTKYPPAGGSSSESEGTMSAFSRGAGSGLIPGCLAFLFYCQRFHPSRLTSCIPTKKLS